MNTRIDTDFLRDQTKTLVPISIPSPLKTGSQFQFIAIAEDMDVPNKNHVYEGKIHIGKALEIEPEDALAPLKEVFGEKAFELLEKLTTIQHFAGDFSIQSSKTGLHSEVTGSLEETIDKVINYPTNQKRLIVQTLQEGWQLGILLELSKTIQESLKP